MLLRQVCVIAQSCNIFCPRSFSWYLIPKLCFANIMLSCLSWATWERRLNHFQWKVKKVKVVSVLSCKFLFEPVAFLWKMFDKSITNHGPPETGKQPIQATKRDVFFHLKTQLSWLHFVNVSRKRWLFRNNVECRILNAGPPWSWPNILSQMK